MRILLFDIDGTLIRSGGAGKHAMEAALKTGFGVAEIRDRVSYSGRTDPGIARDLLSLHDREPSEANIEKLHAEYLTHLPKALKRGSGEVLPGIRRILDNPHPDWTLALLTGNLRAGAEIKLRHFGIWDYFAFGAFADGIPDRDDVARRGLGIVREFMKRDVNPHDVWVIGDTPADVQCARAIGARAVAVKTGWHSERELRDSKPDWYVEDFENAGDLLKEWGWAN
jgi:phosphoglycolate phosphatase